MLLTSFVFILSLSQAARVPVYGYHRADGRGHLHFYTTNAREIGTTTPGARGNHGYVSEGVLAYISSNHAAGTLPFYRYYNPGTGDHFYTTNAREIGAITPGKTGNHGYVSEGVLGYCFPSSGGGTVPIYRYYDGRDHFYTANAALIGTTTPGQRGNHGYISEGIACYMYQRAQLTLKTFDLIGGFEFEEDDHTCGNDKQVCGHGRCCSVWGWCGGGSDYCDNLFEYRNDAKSDHTCPSGLDSECGGTRCCSIHKWCGGQRDGGNPADDWCGSKLESLNHVYGFAAQSEDVSASLTMAFAGILGAMGFGVYKLFQHQKQNAITYESITDIDV